MKIEIFFFLASFHPTIHWRANVTTRDFAMASFQVGWFDDRGIEQIQDARTVKRLEKLQIVHAARHDVAGPVGIVEARAQPLQVPEEEQVLYAQGTAV